MYSTSFLFRIAKAVSVAAIGLLAFLIVVNNTTDYFTNYVMVEHVLKMDSIFPSSHIQYRSFENPVMYHAAYAFIIVMETLMAFCCLKGA